MPENPVLKKKQVWCFSTYFAEGFPFAIIRILSSVFFTDIGMKERYIGYFNFLGIPWNLKFLWGPFLDIFGTKRSWMIIMQAVITVLIAGIGVLCFLQHSHGGNPAPYLLAMAVVLVIMAFFSATNDIAIDGYFMEGIPDKKEQALYTGYRVFAYRIAVIFVRFLLVTLAAMVAKNLGGNDKFMPWAYAFGAAALTMFLITLFNLLALPRFETGNKIKKSIAHVGKEFTASFSTYLDASPKALGWILIYTALAAVITAAVLMISNLLPSTGIILLIIGVAIASFVGQLKKEIALMIVFIILYKIGDEILFSMGTPFLMRELHVTKAQLGWLAGLVGAFGVIAGTSLGGIWIKRVGFKKAIWPLTILMNFNIWAYIWLAWQKPTAADPTGLAVIAAVYCYEQMAAGLGNAVLTVFILRTCKPEFKAGHYAIGSAIMSLFSTVFGGFGGVIVETMGYLNMFLLAFFVSIPSMLLLFWVPIKPEEMLDKK